MGRATRGHDTRRPYEPGRIRFGLSRSPSARRASLLAGTALASVLLLSFLLGSNSAQAAPCIKPPTPTPISDLNVNDTIICVNTEPRTNLAGNAVELSTIGNNHHIDLYNNGLLTAYEYGIFTSTTGDNSLITIENVGDINAGYIGLSAITTGELSNINITNSAGIIAGDISVPYAFGIYSRTSGPNADTTVINSGDIYAGLVGIIALADGTQGDITIANSGDIVVPDIFRAAGIVADTYGDNGNIIITNSGDIAAGTSELTFGIIGYTGGYDSDIEINNTGSLTALTGILGIVVGDNSNVTIRNSGDIAGFDGIGVYAYGANHSISVVNSGAISTAHYGIRAATYGESSPIDIDNSGEITAGSFGINASTVGNSSVIGIGNAAGIEAGSVGIRAVTYGADSPILISNGGEITAGVIGIRAVAYYGGNSHISIDNDGGIISTSGAGILARNYGSASGADSSSGIDIVNTGDIESGLSGITPRTYGSATGDHSNTGITINNAGNLDAGFAGILALANGSASGAYSYAGIVITSIGDIDATYSSIAAFTLGDANGIFSNAGIVIDNSGALNALYDQGIYVQTYGSANGDHSNVSITIVNSGNINSAYDSGILAETFGDANGAYSNAGIDIVNEGHITSAGSGMIARTFGNPNGASSNTGVVIDNSGDISAGDDGIFAATSGSSSIVTITNTGAMSAGDEGIDVDTFGAQGDVYVVNTGAIVSGLAGLFDSDGIEVDNYGYSSSIIVINSGVIVSGVDGISVDTLGNQSPVHITNNASGAITADAIGIVAMTVGAYSPVHITNNAAIVAYGTSGFADYGYGILVTTAGPNSDINIANTGDISEPGVGIGAAAYGFNSDIFIANSGDILATSPIRSAGIGTIALFGRIDIINEGDISASSETSNAYGILALSVVAFGPASPTSIENSGDITAGADVGDAFGIFAQTARRYSPISIENSGDLSATAGNNSHGIFARTFGGSSDIAIANSGDINAVTYGILALSYGASSPILINNGGTLDVTGIGIHTSGISSIEVLNSGIVASGGTGVLVTTSVGQNPADGTVTVTNDGGAIISELAGLRGVAIDVSDAPHPALIDLIGNNPDGLGSLPGSERLSNFLQGSVLSGVDDYGYIFGDILIRSQDSILVEDGLTVFDGVVNPDEALEGELLIDETGKLVMIQNPLEGASAAYVDDFVHEEGGILVMELTPSTDPGDYPTIVTNTANIAGTFTALYQPGLYDDLFVYENVIDANTLVGGYDAAHTVDNSILLVTTAVEENNNIDLVVERTPFDDVIGLTKNQQAVGGGIESTYDDIYDGSQAYQNLVASLFAIDNADDYALFLDQLTGAEYAQHLQSVLWSTRAVGWIINERMECAGGASGYAQADGSMVAPTADVPMAVTGCFVPGQGSLWGRVYGSWNSHDGDEEAPGYDEDQFGVLVGFDYSFDENWFAGVAGGYFDSDMDFDGWGGRSGSSIDYDGLQLAAYGGYDDAIWYLRGVLAYGTYDGDSHRLIQYPGYSPIDPSGDPSSDTWSFYGETGYRWGMAETGSITPFIGLSLATATLDGFTEKDPYGTGAALKIHSSDADSVASRLGVRFMGDWAMGDGTFYPELSVAWEHEFDGTTQKVDMSFAEGPSVADFTVISAKTARDSVLLEAGAKFAIGDTMDFGVYYNGRFNEDYDANAVTGRLGVKF